MKKSTNTLIWTITALVMIAFSNCFIHKENVGAIINIIASLIVTKEIMRVFNKGGQENYILELRRGSCPFSISPYKYDFTSFLNFAL